MYDPPSRTMIVADRWEVRRVDIPGMFNEAFWQAVRVWAAWKQRGWPFSGGWAEQPAHIVEIGEAIEEEAAWRLTSSK